MGMDEMCKVYQMSLTKKSDGYQSIKFVGIVHFTGSQTNFPGLVAVTP